MYKINDKVVYKGDVCIVKDIKEKYFKEFEICSKACSILKDITGLSEIPESEVAYCSGFRKKHVR